MSKNHGASPLKNPLCVALDVDDRDQALKLVHSLKEIVGGFKLGPRLIHRYGNELVQEIANISPVFVDCKFFDIPSTMEAAVRASFEAGASLITVHALSGIEALQKMATLEKELSKQRPFRILAVTILTSWDENSFPSVFKAQPLSKTVEDLADLAKKSGLSSIVCSAHEIEILKAKGLYLLVPGIRLKEDSKGDQKRVMMPDQALNAGASALVVGRPILEAKDPYSAALEFLKSLG